MNDTPSLVAGADEAVVAGQLGRAPHAMSAVAARCPFGFPAVVEDLPYDEAGRPFPTLYYCTCPTLVAAVSADGERRRRGALDGTARGRAGAGALGGGRRGADSAVRRTDLVRAYELTMVDGGASLATGVGGVSDLLAVKCLHAHVAHALARPGYVLGEAILAEVDGSLVRRPPLRRPGRGGGRAREAGRTA